MVKKKSLLQKAISFVTSAVMVLTMGTVLTRNTMRAEAACTTTAEVTAYIDNLKATKYTEGISWDNFYTDSEARAKYRGIECVGFARHIGELLFGTFPGPGITSASTGDTQNGWVCYKSSDVKSVQPGDIIQTDEHAAVVHYVSGSKIYVIEAWGSMNSEIHYGYFNNDYSTLSSIKSNFTFYGIWRYGNVRNSDAIKLSSISVTTPPNTTIYENGSAFNTAGMVVTAKYSDGSTKAVTGYKTSVDLSATGTKNVTISYTESGVTKTAAQSVTVQDLFEGSGTASDPYKIGTTSDLQALADHVNDISANGCYGYAYYIQTADIDLNGIDWVPIGSYYESADSATTTGRAAFNGKYNGNFHSITGLSVNVPLSYAGLFGRCNKYGEISNLAVEGSVSAADNYAGGIVGALCWGSKISGCSFTGTVESLYNTGGIAGIVHLGGYIENCYANAEITATDAVYGYAGGIAGYLRTGSDNSTCTTVEVMNCYFTGTVNGASRTGGITCGVESLSGSYQPELTITNCYYNKDAASGAVNSEPYTGISALSSTLLKVGAELLGDHYTNAAAWQNNGYPVFEWQLDIEGDVNTDGHLTVTDLVMLQKWLLCKQGASLVNWQAGDLCADGRIDAFDLAIMKRKLLSKS